MYGLVPFKFNNRGLTINDMFHDFFNDDILSPFAEANHFKADIRETPKEYLIQTKFDNGVLSIRLPKQEKVINNNNRIEIQ